MRISGIGCLETIAVLCRLHAKLLLEANGEILRIVEANAVGQLVDTDVGFLFHNLAGGLQTYVANEARRIKAGELTQLFV